MDSVLQSLQTTSKEIGRALDAAVPWLAGACLDTIVAFGL